MKGKATRRTARSRELSTDAAESETLSMRGNSMHGNRETLEAPPPDGGGGRSDKALCRTADMHVSRESDGLIVPEKRANKAGLKAAESVEGRGSTKGNDMQVLLAADSEPRKAWHRHAWRTSGLRPTRNTQGRSRYEVVLHVRICAGGRPQGRPYRDPAFTTLLGEGARP